VEAAIVSPPEFACVVAADARRGIGRDNDLPWPRLAGDQAFFKRITTHTRAGGPGARNAVVMGRRTWDSIPDRYRPLPDRDNYVVSRRADIVARGATVVAGLDDAIARATATGVESIYVVGGAQIYAAALADPRCAIVYYTAIDAAFECDTFFPVFDDRFALDAADPPRNDAGVTYAFQRWRRRAQPIE
jgi:dihydrofolate reductase